MSIEISLTIIETKREMVNLERCGRMDAPVYKKLVKIVRALEHAKRMEISKEEINRNLLIEQSDQLLYKAKQNGRNRVESGVV